MDTSENNRSRPRTSALATASAIMAGIGLLVFPFAVTHQYPHTLNKLFINTAALFGLSAVILGAAAILHTKVSSKSLRPAKRTVICMVLGLFICLPFIMPLLVRSSTAYRMYCGDNMSRIARAMLIYANENGRYPDPDQWNDLLLGSGEVTLDNFICPSIKINSPFGELLSLPRPKKGRCSYALNPECRPNSHPDIVLLFETEISWNSCIGAELLKSRHNGEGCNITFNDYRTEFIKTQGLRDLRWKDTE